MKDRNMIRNQILQRIINKSNKMLDDIVKMTMQIDAVKTNEKPVFIPHKPVFDSKERKIIEMHNQT